MARHIAGVVDRALQDALVFGMCVGDELRVHYGLEVPASADAAELREEVGRAISDEWDAGVPVAQAAFIVANTVQRWRGRNG